ncbi:Bsp6I family type II restriction endonuclease [Marinisporobacter balticus]|uniref:Bsp6I restriction endonuclease n=1 Tax=Marinisporobacter balticus TaxID=2018667 RepID=A0A4R2KCM3_9FIRM|nr:Bsp6I family type II restriction endonuclease [Marinisporobacter balticus]TCO70654.1 Bsp6I restriction endonuclease [Marinisporobacter balticus]
MAKKKKLNLVTVDDARFNDAVEMYFLWKELDARIRSSATRGVNFPETISEALCCYVMGFKWNKGSGGDAFDETNERIIEMKATSNWDLDTTSFSPTEEFNDLFFLRLNKRTDELFIYDTGIDSDALKKIKVNKTQTLEEQQNAGRRPRFSVINFILNPMDLEPVAKLNIRTLKIEKY